jgi:hypothetical protein
VLKAACFVPLLAVLLRCLVRLRMMSQRVLALAGTAHTADRASTQQERVDAPGGVMWASDMYVHISLPMCVCLLHMSMPDERHSPSIIYCGACQPCHGGQCSVFHVLPWLLSVLACYLV